MKDHLVSNDDKDAARECGGFEESEREVAAMRWHRIEEARRAGACARACACPRTADEVPGSLH